MLWIAHKTLCMVRSEVDETSAVPIGRAVRRGCFEFGAFACGYICANNPKALMQNMTLRSHRSTQALTAKTADLTLAAPQVVAHRVTRMALVGPMLSQRDRNEFSRMVTEKIGAFVQAWQAMALQALLAQQALAASAWRMALSPMPWSASSASRAAAQVQDAAASVLDKGLTPVHRTVVANAKRLSRTKFR